MPVFTVQSVKAITTNNRNNRIKEKTIGYETYLNTDILNIWIEVILDLNKLDVEISTLKQMKIKTYHNCFRFQFSGAAGSKC